MRHTGGQLDLDGARIAIGRPVRFAGANPNEPLAIERYQAGLGQVGISDPRYVYEPVGAAFAFARTLTRDATVLVADFGGGTSDFSIMRFSRHAGVLKAEPLGHSGLGVAGDTFDFPHRGTRGGPAPRQGGRYRSFGKVLPCPCIITHARPLERTCPDEGQRGSARIARTCPHSAGPRAA